jgi:methylated-DNA-protein-cysteine methyltransferase-like protein
MSPFEETVLKIVRAIPPGRVMSYGQVALYAARPNGAREAGAAMRSLGDTPDFPWWRVLNSAGEISISGNPDANAVMQRDLLQKEGVAFGGSFKLDMDKYRWHAEEDALRALGLDDWIVKSALYKYRKPESTGSLGL